MVDQLAAIGLPLGFSQAGKERKLPVDLLQRGVLW